MSKARALLNARLPSGRRVACWAHSTARPFSSSEILPTPCSLGGRAPIGRSGPPAKREKESLAAMTRQAPRMTGALFCAWDSESVHSRLDGYKAYGLAGRSGSAIRPGTALPRGTARPMARSLLTTARSPGTPRRGSRRRFPTWQREWWCHGNRGWRRHGISPGKPRQTYPSPRTCLRPG